MYTKGDYNGAEFRDGRGGESEWMWRKVDSDDPQQQVVFGTFDGEPVASSDLLLAVDLAVSYSNIHEHPTAASFRLV